MPQCQPSWLVLPRASKSHPASRMRKKIKRESKQQVYSRHITLPSGVGHFFSLFLSFLRAYKTMHASTTPIPLSCPAPSTQTHLGTNTLEHLAGKEPEELPAEVQRFKDGPVLVLALVDKRLLKLVEKLEIQEVLRGQGLLTDDSLHGLYILANSVAGVQLVGHVAVVLARHTLANGTLHETRQRRQDVNGRRNLPVVQLPVNVNLALGNVAGKVGDGVGNVCGNKKKREGKKGGEYTDQGQVWRVSSTECEPYSAGCEWREWQQRCLG